MPDDPLIAALHLHQLLTPADLKAAIRYRQAQVDELVSQIGYLALLLKTYNAALDIRAERDPPIETPERTYH